MEPAMLVGIAIYVVTWAATGYLLSRALKAEKLKASR